jgi:hypothetical protein
LRGAPAQCDFIRFDPKRNLSDAAACTYRANSDFRLSAPLRYVS